MNDQTFDLLMVHLKEIKEQNVTQIRLLEKQNEQQLALITAHIVEDQKVHRVVDRHSIYFSFFSLGVPTVIAYISKKLGLY